MGMAVISLLISTFSSDVLVNINSNINHETGLMGLNRNTSLTLLLSLDLLVVTYLVYLTRGPALSPFTAAYSLVPVFALFLRLDSAVVVIFTTFTILSVVGTQYITRRRGNRERHVQQVADVMCNILVLAVAVWIGIATRGLQ